MLKSALVIALLAVFGGSLAEVDYCDICETHTMCQYTEDVGDSCDPLLKSGVTDEERQEALDAHNEYRSKVTNGQEMNGTNGGQPSATNMRKLSWDDELAMIAQHWVNQCMYKHDTCRNVQRFSVGQSLQETGSTVDNQNPDWRSAVMAWAKEVNHFDKDGIASYHYEKATVHYTQLVWAETYLVGCGYSKYPDDEGYFISFYACNYGPGGNVKTRPIYEEGEPCTGCPEGTTICEDGLCV